MWSIGNNLPNYYYSSSSVGSRDGRAKSRQRSATTASSITSQFFVGDALIPQYNEPMAPSTANSDTRTPETPFFTTVRPPTAPAYTESSLGGLSELLEPAVDGPPSPQRLRALSNQMRQASMASRSSSSSGADRISFSRHGPTSSASSLRSIVSSSSRGPSWGGAEHILDVTRPSSLSRKSSSRSTTSSIRLSAKERPESIQMFGKSIFPRRGRLRRDTADAASLPSHQSLLLLASSTDVPIPEPPSSTTESRFPSIFSRRRSIKPDDASPSNPSASATRKITISGPYNFQHLTHTDRDHLPGLHAGSRMELVNEFASFNTAHRTATMPALFEDSQPPVKTTAEMADFADFSGEGIAYLADDLNKVPLSPVVGHRRMMQNTRSSDQLRSVPPPRPPRPAQCLFPLLNSPLVSPPAPPPRHSSRGTGSVDGFGNFSVELEFDRPATATDSYSLPEAMSMQLANMSAGSHFSHAITTPDDAAWPMPSPSSPLTFEKLEDVPEEEEYFNRSRLSIISTQSSLRGSISVPLMRDVEIDGSRPPSSGSDTLGFLCRPAEVPLASKSVDCNESGDETETETVGEDHGLPMSWEDDIDYAYEHEVEANCSYEWRRSSLDIRIERENSAEPEETHLDTMAHTGFHHIMAGVAVSPEVPALSPSSPAGTLEVSSPSPSGVPCLSNFSLPRSARGRSSSAISAFRDSQTFGLSPSMIIPADYRQQMLMLEEGAETENADEADPDALFIHDSRANFDIKFNVRKNRMSSVYRPSNADRTSTSTMTTLSTIASSEASTFSASLSAERHHSTSTTLTRMTFSSDGMCDWSPVFESGVVLGVEPTDLDFLRHGSSTGDLPATAKAMHTIRPGRRRALTTSNATPSLSIFPSTGRSRSRQL